MDTIAINANEALNEDGQEKKKFKVSDKAKAAMAAGVAGVAAGAAGMSMAGKLAGATDESQTPANESQNAPQEDAVADTGTTDDVVAEVNPDDVMLEEPVAEHSTETDMTAETQLQHSETEEYQPFANNDRIGEDVLPEPQPEEVLIAENTEPYVVLEENPTVDVLCGVDDPDWEPPANEGETVTTDETVALTNDLYADNGSVFGESDVLSDLI